jgi:inositol-phosphate phosphatase/L-galactose 1-phosphate phosphatase/histidinol-phosphatase
LQPKVAANPLPSVPEGVTSAAQLDSADLLKFLAGLPQVSRPFIAKWFRQNPHTTQKADLSPVTIADQQVENALRDVIQAAFPDDAIQGEEFGSATINAAGRFCWVIDPIDGTKAFISGKPVFGTLVGLTDQGVPLAGIIDMPVLDETYIGHLIGHNPADQQRQSACRMNAAIVRPSPCQTLATARLATTSPLALSAVGLTGFNHLAAQAALTNYGGDCHNYALLAAGHIDLVMEDSLAPHDMIAVVAVMQAAGAVVTDTAGQSIRLGQSSSILAAATADLHAAALTALAEVAAN